MDRTLKILILEDTETDAELEIRALVRGGVKCETLRVETETGFRNALEAFGPDVILSDYSMPGFDGHTALGIVQAIRPDVPFIFVSGTIGEEKAVRSLRSGATDYVLKDNLARLAAAVARAVDEADARRAQERAERELREAERRFRLLVDGARDYAIFMLDSSGLVASWNAGAERLFGYSEEEVTARDLGTFLEDASTGPRSPTYLSLCTALETGRHEDEGYRVRKDGTRFWANMVVTPLGSEAEGIVGFAAVVRDMTERKNHLARIERLSRIESVLSRINSAIVRIRDRQDLYKEACAIAVEHGQLRMAWIALRAEPGRLEPAALAGSDAGFLKVALASAPSGLPGIGSGAASRGAPEVSNDIATDESLLHVRAAAAERGYRSYAAFPLVVDGRTLGVLGLMSAEVDYFDSEELLLLTSLAADISFGLEHMLKEERLAYLAFHDPLTGLGNRALFMDRLAQLLGSHEGKGVGVCALDIQRFRAINDSMGRAVGDAVLKGVASALRRVLGESGSVARIGPDLFAMLFAEVEDGTELARRLDQTILPALREPFVVAGDILRISVKAGVATSPVDGKDPDVLLKNAESALERARGSGEDYVFYAPSMNARIAETLTLENKLRIAIEEQEFVLHYQPKVEVATQRIVGVEALIRWQHPKDGLVPPGKFISVLEDTGLIVEVGKWALEKAAADYTRWQSLFPVAPRVAVNVSPLQLRRKDFITTVATLAEKAGRDRGIDIEITEGVFMDDMESSVRKLSALRELGLKIFIDDFGTGFSSLAYIARLPIDALKVDRSFVMKLGEDRESYAIVSTIVGLCRSLGLSVVAEGVETLAQLEHLGRLSCDAYQGYFFSKPVPALQIDALLAKKPR